MCVACVAYVVMHDCVYLFVCDCMVLCHCACDAVCSIVIIVIVVL